MAHKSRVPLADQADVHPNAQRLLDAAIELLGDNPIEQVTLAAVLERSGISNGSLYHHFEDFQDLVEQAIVERFTTGLKESHAAIKAMFDITDVVEFRKRVEQIILTFHEQNRRPFRMTRM